MTSSFDIVKKRTKTNGQMTFAVGIRKKVKKAKNKL